MIKSYISLSLILLLCACTSEPPEPIIVDSTIPKYQLEAWQKLTPNGSIYQLRLEAEAPSDCLNDMLNAQLTNDLQSYTLEINPIIDGVPCENGSIALISDLDLEEQTGVFPLSINLIDQEFVDGQINFETPAMILSNLESDNLSITRDIIFKIPQGVAWGYINEQSVQGFDASEILSLLNPPIGTSPISLPEMQSGDYGYFEFTAPDVISIPAVSGSATQVIFDGRSDDNWSDLNDLLTEAVDKFPSLEFSFWRWNGETLLNE